MIEIYYCCLGIFVTFLVGSQATLKCPTTIIVPEQPQLSPIFLDGYWYEHLSTSRTLNNQTCSHFQIVCNSTTNSCLVRHLIWQSYLLNEIWNGTITQLDDDAVDLTINSDDASVTYDVNVKFQDDQVLIWSCNNTDSDFASLLVRIGDDQELTMENLWDTVKKNMNYFSILDGFPAAVWEKPDLTECLENGSGIYATVYPKLLVAMLVMVTAIQKMQM